jgi:hypothetical protein
MVDGGKIIGGVVVALIVAAVPLWLASAKGAKSVALAKPTGGERCVLPQQEMRKNHPALLANWRERVVRLGERVHRADDGLDVRISLTGTCLGCHGKASEFCERCHSQVAVSLSCWQCHSQTVEAAR